MTAIMSAGPVVEPETLISVVPHEMAYGTEVVEQNHAVVYQKQQGERYSGAQQGRAPTNNSGTTSAPKISPAQEDPRRRPAAPPNSSSTPIPRSPRTQQQHRRPTSIVQQNTNQSYQQQQQQQPPSRNMQSPTSPDTPSTLSSPASQSPSTAGTSPQLTPTTASGPQTSGHSPAPSINNEPLLDHSHLKPGHKASLLSYSQTINQYRENAKKTNSPDIQCDFAVFMVEAAKPIVDDDAARWEFLLEAEKLLKQLSSRGHAESQYYLANLYAQGLLNRKTGKNEFDKAFPLFVQATKHHHPDAAYRAAKCYEDGLGCRKDAAKAVQFYRKASTLNHPGAMYRVGVAELNGELGISKNPRDGVKWLKRAAEAATIEYPHALHELGLLHERGIDNVVFVDTEYAVSLYAQAADLGYAPSGFRLGECYEYGKLGCPQDAALSIHYYTIAAQQGHREACFALTAWYLVGSPGVLPQSDTEAYLWAKKAAEKELPKAEYAVGYFTEVGIGAPKNPEASMEWYRKAAEHGDKRAIQRLEGKAPSTQSKKGKRGSNSDECVIS